MSLVIFVYQQELKNLIPKSAVGTLSSNSSNVIKLIIDAYNVSLHTEHTHTHTHAHWYSWYQETVLLKTHQHRLKSHVRLPLSPLSCSLCRLKSFWKTAVCQRACPSPTSLSVRMEWREQGRTAGSAPTSPSVTRYEIDR